MIHIQPNPESSVPAMQGPILQTLKFHEKRMAELKLIAKTFPDASTHTLEDGEKVYISSMVLASHTELRYIHNKISNLITVRAVAIIKRKGFSNVEVYSTQKWDLSVSQVLNLLNEKASYKDLPSHIANVFSDAIQKKNEAAKLKQEQSPKPATKKTAKH